MSEIPGIEDDIARTRADLADTVDQLAARAAQAKDTTVRTAAIAGGVLAAGVVVYLVVRRIRG